MVKSVRRDIVLATTMIAAVFLMLLVGSAAVDHACVANDGTTFFCGSLVNKSCILNGTMNCPDTHGLIVGADHIVIDGNGFSGDYHNVTISPAITLKKGHEYNYTIITGSYPQIIHADEYKAVEGRIITCEEFVDANEKVYGNWIPVIKLFLW